jgi:hypothetical protein
VVVNTAYQEVVVVAMAVVAVAKSLYVLPDGPTALGHPTNEDLFVGTPVARRLRGVYTGLARATFHGPPVGRQMMIPANGRTDAVYFTQTS